MSNSLIIDCLRGADAYWQDSNPCALVVSGSPVGAGVSLLSRLAEVADFILAVDSGADALFEAGLMPDLLLGDFDSIQQSTLDFFRDSGVELEIHDAYKDATDIELAIDRLLELGYSSIIATNVLGGRIDHELASLGCFAQAAQRGAAVAIVEAHEECLFLSSESERRRLTIATPIAATIPFFSLIPWGGNAIVSISGTEWELDHARLTPFGTLGVSNVPKEDQISVEVHEGVVIAVVENRSEICR